MWPELLSFNKKTFIYCDKIYSLWINIIISPKSLLITGKILIAIGFFFLKWRERLGIINKINNLFKVGNNKDKKWFIWKGNNNLWLKIISSGGTQFIVAWNNLLWVKIIVSERKGFLVTWRSKTYKVPASLKQNIGKGSEVHTNWNSLFHPVISRFISLRN